MPAITGAKKKQSMGCIQSECGNYIYHISIIDYLTTYTVQKQLEKKSKSYIFWVKSEKISSQDPKQYGKRFVNFVKNEIFAKVPNFENNKLSFNFTMVDNNQI